VAPWRGDAEMGRGSAGGAAASAAAASGAPASWESSFRRRASCTCSSSSPPSSPSAVDVAWRAGASRSRCSGGGGGGRPTPRTETAGTTAAASGRAARGEREREWAVGRRWMRRGGAGEGRAAAQVAGRRRCGVPPAACSNPSCSPRLRKGGRVTVAAARPQPPQPNGWCWAAERLG